MADVVSIIGIGLLLVVLVVSVRKQRAAEAYDRAHAKTRPGSDGAQEERSVRRREAARAAARDEQPSVGRSGNAA